MTRSGCQRHHPSSPASPHRSAHPVPGIRASAADLSAATTMWGGNTCTNDQPTGHCYGVRSPYWWQWFSARPHCPRWPWAHRPPVPPPWTRRSGPTAAAKGSATFMVYLTERAELSAAAKVRDADDRAAKVFTELRSTAERSQQSLRADLDQRKVSYDTFWISNVLIVTGDEKLIDAIASRSDVERISPVGSYELAKPEPVKPAKAGTDAVEWGIDQHRRPRRLGRVRRPRRGHRRRQHRHRGAVRPPGAGRQVPRQQRRRHLRPQLQLVRPGRRSARRRAVRQQRPRHPHHGHHGRRRRRRQPDRRRPGREVDRRQGLRDQLPAPTPRCSPPASGCSRRPTSTARTRDPTCAPTSSTTRGAAAVATRWYKETVERLAGAPASSRSSPTATAARAATPPAPRRQPAGYVRGRRVRHQQQHRQLLQPGQLRRGRRASSRTSPPRASTSAPACRATATPPTAAPRWRPRTSPARWR